MSLLQHCVVGDITSQLTTTITSSNAAPSSQTNVSKCLVNFLDVRQCDVACMGEWRGVHGVLVGRPEGKRPLGRPRYRWEDNIKIDLQEVGGGCGDWMVGWRALVSTVMNFRVP
jgi:hypothetical protein